MHIHPLITDSATLANLCTRLAQADFITVDTEFMRESTYWPELCLIQVADTQEAAAIDPLAPGLDLTPLLDLLVDNQEVLKVFHAGGQDIEIIYNLTGKTPHPLFDTQVAAMALGQGEQIGYSNLVDSWLGVSIDKGARFTDWSRRPLDARQIEYAIGDVTYLSTIFPKMLERLRRTGRGAWLDQEMERLADPANYANDPDLAWKRVRISGRKPEVLGRLKALARWRELEARSKDLPRGRIVKDETLGDLAGNPPRKQADLAKVRGLSATWAQNDIGARLMQSLAEATPLSGDELPPKDDKKPGLGKDGALVADLLKLLLKIRARDIDVASRLLARSEELEALASGVRDGLPMLQGWRYDQFGRDAVDLVEGRLGFAVRNGKLKMTRTEEPVA
ncbi:ribonuclease D [Sphingomonas sp. SORGH_AS802]|jgi:ribonuclease D|uniref:ribonuclease D n=1 Tax=unclassified Sphingomonas TaxID=196159 RepID=UPI000F7D7876|nr:MULTISPECIES: ribonuclease D [unclassified Sphingomonas]MDR6126011.1 ribonuclease D [Sphingomonas sp. SORGH_AS_0438]MDR6136530.1 ribonuclease D [Sphingomonas sp. SORGH_AS_0802]RSU45972.1 ribonuclease D [Sphingomonas sp. S-NIH.Pt15_0812]